MATKYSQGDAKGCTGADSLPYRASKSDIGKAVRPPAAPGPDSKGSVAEIKQAGNHIRNPSKTG